MTTATKPQKAQKLLKLKDFAALIDSLTDKDTVYIAYLLYSQKEATVERIADKLSFTHAKTSRKLIHLYKRDYVVREKRGLFMYYAIAEEHRPTFAHLFKIIEEPKLIVEE